jgi:hypothetical protein
VVLSTARTRKIVRFVERLIGAPMTKRGSFAYVIIGGIMLGFIMIIITREIFVVEGAASIRQLEIIVTPYIGPNDQLLLSSQIAQMQSRHDYEQNIAKMTAIAKQHHIDISQLNLP